MDTPSNPTITTEVPATQPTGNSPQQPSKKILLIFLGIIELPLPALALHLSFPLLNLQNQLGINNFMPYIGLIFFILALLVALTQIVMGIFSYDIKLGDKRTNIVIILGLILAMLTIPIIIKTVIFPIFDLTRSF